MNTLVQSALIPTKDQLVEMYCEKRYSVQDIAGLYDVSHSIANRWLKKNGAKARSFKDAAAISRQKISDALKGREISPEWRAKLSDASKRHGDQFAVGISYKTGGYAEHTRGEHKGRSVHVVVMEQHIGRRLLPGEVVHHKDENKQNNDLSNLELTTRSEHSSIHRAEEKARGAGKAKISHEIAAQIRAAYAAGGTSHRKLAGQFGISSHQIGSIVRGEAWK